jgi:hypothetical protein
MSINRKFIFSLFKYLIFLTSISIFLIFCDSNNNQYTGPWKEVPTPGGEGELRACYFTSSDNGWACGWTWNDEENRSYPLLIHWNGTEWEEYPYGGWFNDENFLSISLNAISFSSNSDGWCGGNLEYEYNKHYGFILRYDGNKWYLFQSHLGEFCEPFYALSQNDIWIGVYENRETYFYNWNGIELNKYYTPISNRGISDFDFYSPTEGLAVGNDAAVFRWNGTEWITVHYDVLWGIYFKSVAYDTQNSAWIIGEEIGNPSGIEQVIRLEGDELTRLWDWKGSFEDVYFASPDDGWIVGGKWVDEYHTDTWTWHWDGSGWRGIDCPDNMHAWNIFSLGGDDVWIVGQKTKVSPPICSSWKYEP